MNAPKSWGILNNRVLQIQRLPEFSKPQSLPISLVAYHDPPANSVASPRRVTHATSFKRLDGPAKSAKRHLDARLLASGCSEGHCQPWREHALVYLVYMIWIFTLVTCVTCANKYRERERQRYICHMYMKSVYVQYDNMIIIACMQYRLVQ